MSAPNIFPFTVHAYDGAYVSSPEFALHLWHRDRAEVAPGMSWYGLDLTVKGPSSVEIHVRDIADAFSGGLGRIMLVYEPVLSEGDMARLRGLILKKQLEYAYAELTRRDAAKQAEAIESIRREMFDEATEADE